MVDTGDYDDCGGNGEIEKIKSCREIDIRKQDAVHCKTIS